MALAILIGVGGLALLLVWRSDGELTAAYEDAGKSEVLAIARSFSDDFTEADLARPAVLQQRTEGLRALNPNLEKVSIYRRAGETGVRVASTGQEGPPEPVEARDLEPLRTGRSEYQEEDDEQGGEHLVQVLFPLREPGRAPVAVLGLYYDLAPRDAALAQRQRTLALTGLGTAVLLALLGTLLVGRAVFRPLDRLVGATERLSDGDLHVRVDGSRSDEIGVLARAFNRMADSLESGKAELEGRHAELATRQEALEGALAQVQRVSHQTESILNSVAEGIYGLDAQGRTTFANPAAGELTGYLSEELIGADQHELVHHSHADGTPYPVDDCPVHRALREGTVQYVSDEVYWRRDGSSFPVEYTATPITEGDEVKGAVIVFRDVTERRAVDKMKDEFVSVVSHELRTPLTSIRGSLGLLGGGVLGPLSEKGQRMFDIALSNTDRLVRLINDILDIERIESGQVTMERRECDAGALMREAEQSVAGMAHGAEVALSLSPVEGRLWADPDRIVQVLTNLLSNAIKFSFAGGTVRLSAEQRGEELRFIVSDEGRGIPAERLESIFQRFQQVDSSDSREKGGTGLGLPICRSIVAQHGGRIWAESTPDQGSTFQVDLPALAPRAPTAARSPGAATSVLLCDDDDIVVELVTTLLERRGYRVIAARSGKEALDLAAAQCPDVILLDLMMPGISGWTTTEALKERPQTTDIPVVILSALTPQEREAPMPDVAGWIYKPIDEATLLRALDDALTAPRGDVTRVAIVEDDLDLIEVMTALFEGQGIETFHAHTAAAAVELIPRVEPDLVVLDLMLPDGDGFEVADALRRHDRLRTLPLVVYTARDLNHTERERLRLGETEFLVKGRISPQEFEQRVVGLLERVTGGSAAMPEELAGNGAAALKARAPALGC